VGTEAVTRGDRKLVQLAEDLFLDESTIRFYGVRIQTRMTIVRLSGGRLFVHSPTFLGESTRRQLDELGEVAFVVSPNKIHNRAISQYMEAFPRARFFASPGLVERRPELRFAGVLGDRPHPEWAAELDQVATRGNLFFSEILFLHRPSRTLIVADLVENFDERTASRVGRALAALWGVFSRPVASPEFRFYTDDAEAAAESLRRAREWDFERIVLSHGALIEENAREVFAGVCEDLLARVRRRGAFAKRVYALLARLQ
jgi:hypothetical protein